MNESRTADKNEIETETGLNIFEAKVSFFYH